MTIYTTSVRTGRGFRSSLRLRLALRFGLLASGAAMLAMLVAVVATGATGIALIICVAALVFIVAVVAGCAYFLGGALLAPLHEVTAAANQLSAASLESRLDYQGPADEIKELAQTFDRMLDRRASVVGSQRRFVANASHELRTPLAVMRTEIDVTLADPGASIDELRRMGKVVRNASERANELIESLLLLARTEAQAGARLNRRALVDLSVGVPVTLRAVEAEITRLDLRVSTQFAPASVVGDPGLLERLAGNLIENAVRYNVHHGELAVRTYSSQGVAVLTVTNTGPELDPSEIPDLFEPFRRGGVERTGTRGSGLGLSIVRAVVDAHGGQVQASARPTGGLEVSVYLPQASDDWEPPSLGAGERSSRLGGVTRAVASAHPTGPPLP